MRIRSVIGLCAIASVLGAAPGAGAATPVGAQITVGDFAALGAGRQAVEPAVAFDPSGGGAWIVAFAGHGESDAGIEEIYVQRVGLDGTLLGGAVRVSDTAAAGSDRDADTPRIARDTISGRFLVTWRADSLTYPQSDNDTEIFGRLLTAGGVPIGGPVRLTVTGPDVYAANTFEAWANVGLAFNATRREWLVTYQWNSNLGEDEIYGQRVDADAGRVGPSFAISANGGVDDPSAEVNRGDVAYNAARDEYLVVYQGNDHGVTNDTDVYGRRVAGDGTVLGPDDVNLAGASTPLNTDPRVVWVARHGEYVVAYDGDIGGGEEEVVLQRVTATGTPTGAPVRATHSGPDGNGAIDAVLRSLTYAPGPDELLVGSGAGIASFQYDVQRFAAGPLTALDAQTSIAQLGAAGNAFGGAAGHAAGAREYLVTYSSNSLGAAWKAYARRVAAGADVADPPPPEPPGPGSPAPTPATPAPSTPAPPPLAAPGAGAASRATPAVALRAVDVIRLPSTKRCLSRRYLRVTLRPPKGATMREVRVTITGRRAMTIKGARLKAPVDLRGLPKGRFSVTVRVRFADGRSVVLKRAYRTCAPKRSRRS